MSSEPTPTCLTRAEEDADVAFALEGVPWVRAVYVVDEPRADERRYLVHLTEEAKGYGHAEVHYALMRSRGRRDSADVDLVSLLPPLGHHRLLAVSAAARDAARGRARADFVPEVLAEVYPARRWRAAPNTPPSRVTHHVLVIDDDPVTERAARLAFPWPDRIVVCPFRDAAVALMRCWRYDRVVVSDSFALGEGGILSRLLDFDAMGILPLVVIAPPERVARAERALMAKNRLWHVLAAPLDASVLALRFGRRISVPMVDPPDPRAGEALLSSLSPGQYASPADSFLRSHRENAPSTEAPLSDEARVASLAPLPRASSSRATVPKVLVLDPTLEAIDAKQGAGSSLDITIVTSFAEADARLRADTYQALLCDSALRHDDRPAYRELWDRFPGLMSKTVLVTSVATVATVATGAPENRARLESKRLLARPLTAARLVAAVRSFHGGTQ